MVITKEVALEDTNSSFISLSEYGRIDDDAAAVFGGRDFDEVTLDLAGLTELSDIAAEHLSKHKGDLYLDELKELSDSAAKSLASQHEGLLSLMGLKKRLSDSAAAHLAAHNRGSNDLEIEPGEWNKSAFDSYLNAIGTKSDGCLSSTVVIIGLLWSVYELTP